jgi:hypothetical protein
MYNITDEQIDFILNDIRRNGIEMEELQYDLLDHICCIIEQNLNDNDDFESYYRQIIKHFYIKELKEIETETIQLLTFKNFYSMKKFMIISGITSVIAILFGSFFKIMYWPGANVLLGLGILLFSILFLPLVFLLKTKEAPNVRDKYVFGAGAIAGMMQGVSIIFHMQQWQYSGIILLSTLGFAFFVFLPLYFFYGIRNPTTKLNTIVTSIIFLGFLGMQFTIVGLRKRPETDKVIVQAKK